MNEIGMKDSLSIRALQGTLLLMAVFFSNYYALRSSVYLAMQIVPNEIGGQAVIALMLFTSSVIVLAYYVFIKYAYQISNKLYKTMLYKRFYRESTNNIDIKLILTLPPYPIKYRDFSYYLIWYYIAASIITGMIRLLAVYYPFTYSFFQSFAPIVINVSLMLLFFAHMRGKYISDNIVGSTFLSLCLPYMIVVIVLM